MPVIDQSTQDLITNSLKKYAGDVIAESLVQLGHAKSAAEAKQMVADVIAAQQPVRVEPAQQTATEIDGRAGIAEAEQRACQRPFNGALHVALKGVPQIPLRPRTKIAFLDTWEQLATTDPAQLNAWHAQYPEANWAGVALAQPGGIWIFEIDNADAVKQRLGSVKLPRTFMVRSRPGRGHYYFRHNALSIALAQIKDHISIKDDQGKEIASARVHHAYCVSAGSIHPETQKPYEIVNDVDLIEAPQELIDWIKAQQKDSEKLPLTASLEGPKIPFGSHDNELTRIAGKLRQDGMEEDTIANALIEICEKRCEDYGSDYREMCQKIAHSIGKKPIRDDRVYHNGVLVGSNGQPTPAVQTTQSVVIETEPIVTKESLPEFPEMSGVLWDMALALCPDLPLEFKFMSLVTHWGLIRSGIDILDGEAHYQPRFDTCLVGEPQSGKSASITESDRLMAAIRPPGMRVFDSVDSGPALVDDFAELANAHPAAKAVQVLIEADEMTDLFEKSKITAQSRNSLSTLLLSLFEKNSASNRARSANKGKRTQVENAHLAVLGGTTYLGAETMWNKIGGGANGLQSRFVPIVTTQRPLGRATRTPSDADALTKALNRLIKLNELPGQTIFLDAEAQQELNDWWAKYSPWDKASVRRIDDIVKRMIIVLAVTNIDPSDRDLMDDDRVVVSKAIITQACSFGDYVIMVRERVNPVDSYSWTQAFENNIIEQFRKQARPLTMRDVRRLLTADRKPGGLASFLQAWKNVIAAEAIEPCGMTNKGTEVYRLESDNRTAA